MNPPRLPGVAIASLLVVLLSNNSTAACRDSGVQLQVLGSGGPGTSSGRASSAYLLWVDGQSRVLVDAGGGTKDQLHGSGASLDAIQLIALSHFHPDHSAELPAILWPAGGSFRLAGPSGAGVYPSLNAYVAGLFGDSGVFQVLGDRTAFEILEIDGGSGGSTQVWRDRQVVVEARAVPHGDVPTLAYRVEAGGVSIGLSSDQNGSDPAFVDFIRGVDLLVIHLAATEDASGRIAELHARPSVWGTMAAEAEVGRVLVSHISTSNEAILAQSLAILEANYGGPITVAEDLACIDFP